MTREESIERANATIRGLRNAADDIEHFMKFLIDFDDDMEGLGPLDNIGGDENCQAIGIACEENSKVLNILFYRKYDLYTKTMLKK